MQRIGVAAVLSVALHIVFARSGLADAPITLENVGPVPTIRADEPFAKELSFLRATSYLDTSALAWQKAHECGACHTNFAYMMARPLLNAAGQAPQTVRQFFESMVTDRWEDLGPRWDAEVVVAAAMLAINDRLTSGKLHPVTQQALERMWTLQRDDGGWDWLDCGWPPMEFDDHYGVTLAAIGVGSAPDDYAKSPAAQKGLDGIRRFLHENPVPTLHHQAMILWAAAKVDGILTDPEKHQFQARLLAAKRSDGGWALGHLLAGWEEHQRKDDLPQEVEKSDAYATGLVLVALRESGMPASDERLASGLEWLKRHQRESGRWFTPSPTKDSKHYISNAGTALAVMALRACEEVPESLPAMSD